MGTLKWKHLCECEHSYGHGRLGITNLKIGNKEVS